MTKNLNRARLLEELENGLRLIFPDDLSKIIMYGSYARGDNVEGSDLDIMVLVDQSAGEIEKNRTKFWI